MTWPVRRAVVRRPLQGDTRTASAGVASVTDDIDVTIVTSGHDVADARLHREVAAMLTRGISVEVLGLGDAADGPEGALVRTWLRPGVAGRAALAARLVREARGRVLMALDPDSGVAACLGARIRGRRVVIDVHEDYAALLNDRAWARRWRGAAGMLGRATVSGGTRLFRTADLVVVADDHLAPRDAPRRMVVRNLPDRSMLPAPAPRSEHPRALYIGDLRASRGLFAMLAAVRRAPGWSLDLVGPVAPADAERLRAELAANPDLAARVHLHGRKPPASSWRDGASAWVGMLLLTDTPAFRDAVPSKLYEYLACGLPVITTDLPRPAALVRGAQAGEVVAGGSDDIVSGQVARILNGWSADATSLDAARHRLAAEAAAVGDRRTPYDDLADAIADLSRTQL